jgi:hypothetical protein
MEFHKNDEIKSGSFVTVFSRSGRGTVQPSQLYYLCAKKVQAVEK